MLQDKFSIPTDHFFKFLAIFGLVATIYCFSFPFLFIEPYNEKIDQNNLVIAELKAEEGYLKGSIKDVQRFLPDTIESTKISYNWGAGETTSIMCFYIPITADTLLNKIINHYNSVNLDLAKVVFKKAAIQVSGKVNKRNLNINQIINCFFTVLSLLLTCWGMILWYNYQKVLDDYQAKLNDYQGLLIEKQELENESLRKTN
jgi:hypothetical protein